MYRILEAMCNTVVELLEIINGRFCNCNLPECDICNKRKSIISKSQQVVKTGFEMLKEFKSGEAKTKE